MTELVAFRSATCFLQVSRPGRQVLLTVDEAVIRYTSLLRTALAASESRAYWRSI